MINELRSDINKLHYIEEGLNLSSIFLKAIKHLGRLSIFVVFLPTIKNIKNALKHDDYETAAYEITSIIVMFVPWVGFPLSMGVEYLKDNPEILRSIVTEIEHMIDSYDKPKITVEMKNKLQEMLLQLQQIPNPNAETQLNIKKIQELVS